MEHTEGCGEARWGMGELQISPYHLFLLSLQPRPKTVQPGPKTVQAHIQAGSRAKAQANASATLRGDIAMSVVAVIESVRILCNSHIEQVAIGSDCAGLVCTTQGAACRRTITIGKTCRNDASHPCAACISLPPPSVHTEPCVSLENKERKKTKFVDTDNTILKYGNNRKLPPDEGTVKVGVREGGRVGKEIQFLIQTHKFKRIPSSSS